MDVEYHRKCFHINLDLIQQKVAYQSLILDHQQLNQLFKQNRYLLVLIFAYYLSIIFLLLKLLTSFFVNLNGGLVTFNSNNFTD